MTFLTDVTNTVMGIMLIYAQTSQAGCNIWDPSAINIATSYSIYVSLNVVLTVMIVARLVLLRRSIQNALNAPVRVGGLYNALVTMMIESCALYAVTFLLFIGSWAAGSSLMYVFFPVLSQTQVRAVLPFPSDRCLIIQWTGHCSVLDHITSRQQEHAGERHHHLPERRFDSLQSRGFNG